MGNTYVYVLSWDSEDGTPLDIYATLESAQASRSDVEWKQKADTTWIGWHRHLFSKLRIDRWPVQP